MSLAALSGTARACGLALRGAFHPDPGDRAPEGTGTLVLLGPDEPGIWTQFESSPEYQDGLPDPLDRWSERVLGGLAQRFGGAAILPSDGPPWPPFLHWAERTGEAFPSPIGLYTHVEVGLMISYRGAIALPDRLALPAGQASPCETCTARPCTTACPVGALSAGATYDVPACQRFLRSVEGRSCRQRGCRARLACPLSHPLRRRDQQAAFHMAAFMGNWDDSKGESA